MIQRKQFPAIMQWLEKRQYIILKGARRVGKTTLLLELQKHISHPSAFLVCDNLDFSLAIKTPQDLMVLISAKHGFVKDKPFVLFLDEFQAIPQAGLFLKNLYDEYPLLKIIASGSSALEITKNTEFLTGRSVEFFITPFSFQEFFSYKTGVSTFSFSSFEDWKGFYKVFEASLHQYFLEYVQWGGYPEIVLAATHAEKKMLLENYIQKYIQKDITQFLKVENISGFNHLLKLLAGSIGNLLNENEISNTLGIANKTVQKYLDILEGTYIIHRCRPFYSNVRTEISKMPKQYFADLGIRNALLKRNESMSEQIDIGAEVENIMANELFIKNAVFPKFYRTMSGSEIDYIEEKENTMLSLIEIKYRNNQKSIRAFTEFEKKYPEKTQEKIVITKDVFEQKEDVLYIPAPLFGVWNM